MSSYPQTGTSWFDLSGNSNTGVLTNGPAFVLSSGSFSFDGVDDYVEISNNNGFGTAGVSPVATLGFTANLQRKSGGGVQFQQVAGFRNGGTYEFFFLLLDASGATVPTEARVVTNGGFYDINVDYTSYFDKWTRVDFVANSNRTDLYFNESLVGSNTNKTGSFASSLELRIGQNLSGTFQTITLTGNLTLTTSNRAVGRFLTVRLLPGASIRNLEFPSDWNFVGGIRPSSIPANKVGIITLMFFGTADADCVASAAIEQ
jgi:hypothetical protein